MVGMIIISKFLGTCRRCGGSIQPGTEIEWAKGVGARHVHCAHGHGATTTPDRAQSARRTTSRTSERRPSFPATAPVPGAVLISGRRTGRSDRRYDVGTCIHAPTVRDAGGGPDGHYYTVLAARMTPPNDDNQQFDWEEYAWARPATDAEAAPIAARVAAREARETLTRDLQSATVERERGAIRMPADAAVLVPRDTAKTCATGERVAVVDGTIYWERVGDPDMCDSWYHYLVRVVEPSPELLERARTFCATVQR
jgi:hypothetical protein